MRNTQDAQSGTQSGIGSITLRFMVRLLLGYMILVAALLLWEWASRPACTSWCSCERVEFSEQGHVTSWGYLCDGMMYWQPLNEL